MKTLSKLSFILLISISLFSCNNEPPAINDKLVVRKELGTIKTINNGTAPIYVYVIDSCEYIGYIAGYHNDYLAHKGNCKFCTERRKHSLK